MRIFKFEVTDEENKQTEQQKLLWLKFMNKYFSKEWMTIVKPETFSVYNIVDRTNNCLESYHRWLHAKLRTNPSAFQFLRKITIRTLY